MNYLTYKEVAEMLGCSISSVRRLVKAGKLAYYRITPRLVRFQVEDVLAYVKRKKEKS